MVAVEKMVDQQELETLLQQVPPKVVVVELQVEALVMLVEEEVDIPQLVVLAVLAKLLVMVEMEQQTILREVV